MPYDTGTGQLINQLTNPPNPFEKFGATIDFANKLKDFQAQKAISDIYSQSIDPTTGQVDFGKFNALASQNPAAMWKLGASQQQAGQGQQALSQGTSQQLQAAQDQLGAQAAYLTGLLPKAQNGTLTADDIRGALKDMPPGLMSPTMMANINNQLDSGANPVNVFWGGMFANNHAREILGGALGPVSAVTTGPTTTFVRQSPTAPAGVAAPVTMGLTPQNQVELKKWLAEPYSWTDTAGKTHTGTKESFYASRGEDPLKLFGNNNIPAPGSEPPGGPVSTVTTGRVPVKPSAPSGAGAPASGSTAPGVMGTLPAAPPTLPPPAAPGATQPSTQPGATTAPPSSDSTVAIPPEQIEAGRKAYAQDQDVQSTLGTRVGPLESAISALRAHPNLQTVGQDEINQLTQVANAFGFKVGDLNNANAYQELSKYLEGYLRNLPGANRSDLAQGQAAAASPHIGQGREAMQALLAKAVGYERLRAAGYDYFNSQYPDAVTASKDSAQYKSKTASWLAQQDPVAYAVDEMTPAQYSDYIKGLTRVGKDKLKASRLSATQLYPWLHPPGMSPDQQQPQ